jgi:hypothetical protein
MRNISFSLTEEQFLDGSKDITRRLGWANLKPGDRLMGCRKCMGLRPGESIVRLVAGDVKLKAACHALFLGEGEGQTPKSPLFQLREFLVSDDAVLLNRGTDRGLAELTLLALHLHVTGGFPPTLELSQSGLHAFRALQSKRVAMVERLFKLS